MPWGLVTKRCMFLQSMFQLQQEVSSNFFISQLPDMQDSAVFYQNVGHRLIIYPVCDLTDATVCGMPASDGDIDK